MHDPCTVAFNIKSPFRSRPTSLWPEGYRNSLVTIWHRDPERGGCDDSCGYSYVRLSQDDLDWCRKEAADNWRSWFSGEYGSINIRTAGDIQVIAAVWTEARHRAAGVPRHRPLSAWDIGRVLQLASNPCDNVLSTARRAKSDPDGLADLFRVALRCYKTFRRPWWRHPRWHVHHWRFQIHPWQHFRRWLLSRCCKCGGRFGWNETVVGTGWDSAPVRWFRGETDVMHSRCSGAGPVC